MQSSHSLVVIDLAHDNDSLSDGSTTQSAALLEAEEDELHDEEGRQGGGVAHEGDCCVFSIDWRKVKSASLTSDRVTSDSGEDATGEERNTEAADAASGDGDERDGDAWDEDAEHHEGGDDQKDQVDEAVVFVRGGPASEHGISCIWISGSRVNRCALSAKVIEGHVSCLSSRSGEDECLNIFGRTVPKVAKRIGKTFH